MRTFGEREGETEGEGWQKFRRNIYKMCVDGDMRKGSKGGRQRRRVAAWKEGEKEEWRERERAMSSRMANVLLHPVSIYRVVFYTSR